MRWALLWFLAWGVGCGDDPAPQPLGVPDHWSPGTETPGGPVSLVPDGIGLEDPGHEGNAPSHRLARRMSVDQLQRSIPRLFAGITWTYVPPGREGEGVNLFDVLSRTLGEADYRNVMDENLDPSPLFAKFMDDMAGDVCAKAVAHDNAAGAGAPILIFEPGDVDATLRRLRLKLHGLHVPDDSLEGLESARGLYDAILGDTGSVDLAWTGTCIFLLTAPEMMAY